MKKGSGGFACYRVMAVLESEKSIPTKKKNKKKKYVVVMGYKGKVR